MSRPPAPSALPGGAGRLPADCEDESAHRSGRRPVTTIRTPSPFGLSTAEAEERRRRGEANAAVDVSSRSYARILRTNVFSFYNTILFVIGAALLALGRWNDALVSVGLGLLNAAICAVQEIRAKRKLDQLQLLAQSVVHVVRDGVVVEVPPTGVVRGDLVRLRPGDQVVVDEPVVDGRVDVDESLLTGEPDPLVKQPGDDLLSGSFCVGGEAHQLARDVGAASYANRLTVDARRASNDLTPLQRRIEFVVRLVMALVALMTLTILLQAALEGFTLLRTVQTTAALSGLVPYGLFFLIALAYTVGAVKSSRAGPAGVHRRAAGPGHLVRRADGGLSLPLARPVTGPRPSPPHRRRLSGPAGVACGTRPRLSGAGGRPRSPRRRSRTRTPRGPRAAARTLGRSVARHRVPADQAVSRRPGSGARRGSWSCARPPALRTCSLPQLHDPHRAEAEHDQPAEQGRRDQGQAERGGAGEPEEADLGVLEVLEDEQEHDRESEHPGDECHPHAPGPTGRGDGGQVRLRSRGHPGDGRSGGRLLLGGSQEGPPISLRQRRGSTPTWRHP
jgi:hypothetical protein